MNDISRGVKPACGVETGVNGSTGGVIHHRDVKNEGNVVTRGVEPSSWGQNREEQGPRRVFPDCGVEIKVNGFTRGINVVCGVETDVNDVAKGSSCSWHQNRSGRGCRRVHPCL